MTIRDGSPRPAIPPEGFSLRPLRDGDIAGLCALSWRAGRLFADHGYPAIAAEPLMSETDFRDHFADTEIAVAEAPDGRPAGFAATLPIGEWLWLAEISVDPAHGRQGIGAALLEHVAGTAADRNLAGVALSTFRDVPFNAPFYRGRGFAEVAPEAAPAVLAARWQAEIPPGATPSERLLMLRRA